MIPNLIALTVAALAVLFVAIAAPGVIRQRREDRALARIRSNVMARVFTLQIEANIEAFLEGSRAAGAAIADFGVTAAQAAKAVEDFAAGYRQALQAAERSSAAGYRQALQAAERSSAAAAAEFAQARPVTADSREETARGLDTLIPPTDNR